MRALWPGASNIPQCPLHGDKSTGKKSIHDEILRRVTRVVSTEDKDACVIPQCRVIGTGTRARRMFFVDLVAVLGNGNVVAIECDGRSHDKAIQIERDEIKQRTLAVHYIDMIALDIRKCPSRASVKYKDFCDNLLAKVRLFIRRRK